MGLDLWDGLAESFEPKKDYTEDPVGWLTDIAGEFAWSVQRRIMRALVTDRMVAVPSCHGVGKSHIASRIAAWWVAVHGDDPTEVFLVTTAPTAAQVSAVLWRYIGQIHNKADLPGRINRSPYPQWWLERDQVGFGRKPADYEDSAFQGIHARYVLIIVDEACGIQPGLWDQLSSLASNRNARILAIGNPTDASSFFYRLCKPDSDYTVIQVDGLRTPNMTEAGTREYPLTRALMQGLGVPFSEERIPEGLDEQLIDPLYIEERIRAYAGFTKRSHLELEPAELTAQLVKKTSQSPMFLARVRGVFPTDASTGVIPLGWAQLGVQRWHDWDDAGRSEQPGRRKVGIDVAYFGEDETCLAIAQGMVVQTLQTYAKQDTLETVAVAEPWLDWPQAIGIVDVNGIGAGVYDTLRRYAKTGRIQGSVIPFNASERSVKRDAIGEFGFLNDRAAAWWNLRQLLDPSRGATLAIPDDEDLLTELTSVQYKIRPGRPPTIQIEDKEQIKKRIKRSTDRADAVAQAMWVQGLALDRPGTDGVVLDTVGGVVQYAGHSSFTFEGMFGEPMSGGWDV